MFEQWPLPSRSRHTTGQAVVWLGITPTVIRDNDYYALSVFLIGPLGYDPGRGAGAGWDAAGRAVGNLPLGGLGSRLSGALLLEGMVVSPGVLSHAEGHGLHDPNRRTGGVVRRRRVGTLGAHEL